MGRTAAPTESSALYWRSGRGTGRDDRSGDMPCGFGIVKRSTAIRNLVTVAEAADHHAATAGLEWPLHQMWVAGEILDGPATLEVVSVILGLDVPAAELPWLALHPAEQVVADQLRLPKLPIRRYARPIAEPIWNPAFRRVARFWDVTTGLDQHTVEALESGDPVPAVEPTPDEYARQMTKELTRCRAHLDAVLDSFWEPAWRKAHRGGGIYPEDHLWRAAQAVRDLEAAVEPQPESE